MSRPIIRFQIATFVKATVLDPVPDIAFVSTKVVAGAVEYPLELTVYSALETEL